MARSQDNVAASQTPRAASPLPRRWDVSPGESGQRFDLFLVSKLEGVSRGRVQAAIRAGTALRNGQPAEPSRTLATGDLVEWQPPPPPPPLRAEPEALPLKILFEDEALLVLDKPAGMVVHPGAGNASGTLVSALLHHTSALSSAGGPLRPGIVHRLDKETSGVLVVAKTDAAHAALAAQFAGRGVRKVYLAVVERPPQPSQGRIEAPVGRHPAQRKKMAVREGGRRAVTDYELLGRAPSGFYIVACLPLTGRTHQIRVHLKHLGCPIVGDPLYGRRGRWPRHLLHAWKLEFDHPLTGRRMAFEAPPPVEFFPETGLPSQS